MSPDDAQKVHACADRECSPTQDTWLLHMQSMGQSWRCATIRCVGDSHRAAPERLEGLLLCSGLAWSDATWSEYLHKLVSAGSTMQLCAPWNGKQCRPVRRNMGQTSSVRSANYSAACLVYSHMQACLLSHLGAQVQPGQGLLAAPAQWLGLGQHDSQARLRQGGTSMHLWLPCLLTYRP